MSPCETPPDDFKAGRTRLPQSPIIAGASTNIFLPPVILIAILHKIVFVMKDIVSNASN
jgi:hypothetical protein